MASRPTEAAMSRCKKEPLRELTAAERQAPTPFPPSLPPPALRAPGLEAFWAAAGGDSALAAARPAGRRAWDAPSHLVAPSTAEGMPARAPRHGGGRRPTYGPEDRRRIAAEAARA